MGKPRNYHYIGVGTQRNLHHALHFKVLFVVEVIVAALATAAVTIVLVECAQRLFP